MPYFDEIIQHVWEKGREVSDNDPDTWRKDAAGAWIRRQDYGNRDSQYGWEIDHIQLESEGGGDELSNLRPLQWQNNAARQDDPFTFVVTSSGKNNVEIE